MSRKKIGALPRQTLVEMFEVGCFPGARMENIQPASIDLSVSGEIYRMPGVIQPRLDESVRELIERVGGMPYDINFQLEVGVAYLARLHESVKLPKGIYGYCNPKSTTGRHDMHVRVVADGVPRYDALFPKGFVGELWVSIIPHSYPVRLFEGVPLSQLRLFSDDTRLDELELQLALQKHKLLWHRTGETVQYDELRLSDKDGSIILTADLDSDVIGWECTSPSRVVDFSRRGYVPDDFFREVKVVDGYIHLKQGRFYILSTAEYVRVPPELACEMRPMDDRSGNFRAHYAGFIDPGWGWGLQGEGKGRPLTLEVRSYEDMILGREQPIAKIRFERMKETPDVVYDAGSSNYSVQSGPRLAKHFIVE